VLLRSVVDSCVYCGRSVSAPVKLTDLSRKPSEETYYACPFCFSRLDVEDVSEHLERSHGHHMTLPPSSVDVFGSRSEKSSGKRAGPAVTNCSYGFGYLHSRPKDAGIPDDCLTCPKILQCMAKSA
jgi:DNA-directed RNA polymerase subunit RPC12/RpoP